MLAITASTFPKGLAELEGEALTVWGGIVLCGKK